jgi:hypothetical protein
MRRLRRSEPYRQLLISLRLFAVAWMVIISGAVWLFASPPGEFPLTAFIAIALGGVVHLWGVLFLLRAIRGDSEVRKAWNSPGILPGILITTVVRDVCSPTQILHDLGD